MITFEICAGNLEDVYSITGLNVDRIELNSALELGGLTPSLATLKKAKELFPGKIVTMIRPRTGGFLYGDKEYEVMIDDAKLMLEHGADGIVIGFLKGDGTIDEERLATFCEIAKSYNKEIVFHRAFDHVKDDDEAIEVLIKHGVNRILLMGKEGMSFDECAARVGRLEAKYGDQIELLAGGGLNPENVNDFINKSKVRQVHGTCKELRLDKSTHQESVFVSRIVATNMIGALGK